MTTTKSGINQWFELLVKPASLCEKEYLLSNSPNFREEVTFDFFWTKKGKEKAVVTFFISKDSIAKSLPKSPFGGFFILEKLSSEALEDFILAVVENLKERGVTSLEITCAPKPYEEHHDLILYLLHKNNFVQKEILSHQFFIGKKKIKKWVSQEHHRFQKKIIESGLTISIGSISNFNFLKEIRDWNLERGYEVNHDDNRIVMQVSEFPDRYFLISILDGDFAVAHCLAVKLFPDSIYYFLSAINPKSNLKNGGELLLFHLFKLASDQKVKMIDLGSSDLDSGVNHPLMFFKSKFANDVSNKETWVRNF